MNKNKNTIIDERNRDRIVIAFTAFLNFFGLTLAFPVFVPLLSVNGGLVPVEMTKEMRGILLGILLGIYPLVQFLTAPVLGILSDRFGRKPVLIFTAAGNIIGCAMIAVGIWLTSLWIVLAGRVLSGLFSGSLSVTQSAMSDISDPASRPKNFGLMGAMMGASLALGPAAGGLLSDHHLSSFFQLYTPFIAAAVMSAVNLVFLWILFSETHHHSNREHHQVDLFTGPRNFIAAFADPKGRLLFAVVFLYSFGFNFFSQFFQYYLIERFQVTNTQFGLLFGYIGLWSILTQALFTKWVARLLKPEQVLLFSIVILACLFPLLLLMPSYYLLYAVALFIPVMNGLSYPNTTSLVSGLADKRGQGRILGVNQSVQAVAMFIPPLAGGYLIGINYTMPVWVTFGFIFLSWIVYLIYYRNHHKKPVS